MSLRHSFYGLLPAVVLLVLGITVAESAEAGVWERRVYPAFELGVEDRGGSGNGPTSGPGLTYGVVADIIVLPWLYVTPRVVWSKPSLSTEPEIKFYDGPVEATGLSLLSLSLGVNFVLEMGPDARGLAGVSVAWNRAVLPPLHTDTKPSQWLFVEKSGVFVDFPFMLGAEYDVIPEWFTLGVRLYGNPFPPIENTGDLFAPKVGLAPDGTLIEVGPIQGFRRLIGGTLLLGLIL